MGCPRLVALSDRRGMGCPRLVVLSDQRGKKESVWKRSTEEWRGTILHMIKKSRHTERQHGSFG